jgi:hypothetical protein
MLIDQPQSDEKTAETRPYNTKIGREIIFLEITGFLASGSEDSSIKFELDIAQEYEQAVMDVLGWESLAAEADGELPLTSEQVRPDVMSWTLAWKGWESTQTGKSATGKRKISGNKKPLSNLSAEAHQPTGAVLWAIIRFADISSTADQRAMTSDFLLRNMKEKPYIQECLATRNRLSCC